ncbi:hypothetical protein ES705_31101 [subsurface metagenome]
MKKVKLKMLKDFITEKDVRKVCKDYLLLKGWFVFHLLQGLGCYPGLADMGAIKDGRTLFIETKKPGGKQSEAQKIFQADIERAGEEYVLVSCLEDLINRIM